MTRKIPATKGLTMDFERIIASIVMIIAGVAIVATLLYMAGVRF